MPLFSANLGLLWSELPLPCAIRAAAKAGFVAVEFQWPYNYDPIVIRAALDETNLPALSLNTELGSKAQGTFGTCAQRKLGQRSVEQALAYAQTIGARAVHALPGIADGEEAWRVFEETLRFACDQAKDMNILIEPLNGDDVPGYLLQSLDDAIGLIERINHPRLKLMFDFYHIGRMHNDPIKRFRDAFSHIGHIQFASVPDRGSPDHGALNFDSVFAAIDDTGWSSPLGAEYRPDGPTEATLDWLVRYKS